MNKLLLAAAVSLTVTSLPVVAHHPALDSNIDPETWIMIDENLEEVESPHLDMTFDDMGSSDDMGSDGTSLSGDAVTDREEGGEQESDQSQAQEDAGDDNSDGMYKYQEDQYKPGVSVDEELNPEQTETTFRSEVSTPSGRTEDGRIQLSKGDTVKIASELEVADEDIGESAECMVIVQYQTEAGEPSTFMLSEDGWKGWSGDLYELSGVKCELGENHRIMAYDGELIPGEFKFYFGYQLGDGKTVANSEALTLTVEE